MLAYMLLPVGALGLAGCAGPQGSDSDDIEDSDADTDADTDSDTDADTDSDTDADTDADLELNGDRPDVELPAIDFEVTNRDGTLRDKDALLGHPTVIWFYPAAGTSG